MYCFDTDALSATVSHQPSLVLIRRIARVPVSQQYTTAITMGELLYGAAQGNSKKLTEQVHSLITGAITVLPFDESAADIYGPLRAKLESKGQPLAEPDLRIASISLSHGLTLITGNAQYFERIPGLRVENWLEP